MKSYQVVGIGNAIVDVFSSADDSFLDLMGIQKGIMYSFPVTCANGNYTIVQGLEVSDFSRDLMQKTEKELTEERDAVAHLLP